MVPNFHFSHFQSPRLVTIGILLLTIYRR